MSILSTITLSLLVTAPSTSVVENWLHAHVECAHGDKTVRADHPADPPPPRLLVEYLRSRPLDLVDATRALAALAPRAGRASDAATLEYLRGVAEGTIVPELVIDTGSADEDTAFTKWATQRLRRSAADAVLAHGAKAEAIVRAWASGPDDVIGVRARRALDRSVK
jgi:hypothetical protein